MNKAVSLYFEFLRGFAAVLVTYHYYNRIYHYPNGNNVFPDVGQDAVVFFFIMSGYIISWIVATRDTTAKAYMINRMSRIYSVLLPSIIIGVLLTKARHMVDITTYDPSHLENVIYRSGLIALFSNYNNVFGAVNLARIPTWSLTYEVWYYFIFAALCFIRKGWWKWGTLALIAAYLGFEPLLFFPTWFLGALLYRYRDKLEWSPGLARTLFILSALGMVIINVSGVKHAVAVYSILGFKTNELFGHSQYFLYFYALAAMIAIHIVAAIRWPGFQEWLLRRSAVSVWIIRRVAHTSFILYLLHNATMLLLHAAFGGQVFLYFLPTVTIILLAAIGKPIEDSKTYYRKFFKFILGKFNTGERVAVRT